MTRSFAIDSAATILGVLLPVACACGAETVFPPELMYVGGWPTCIAVADVDGDGHLDFAINDYDSPPPYFGNYYGSPYISVLKGDGDGAFPERDTLDLQPNVSGLSVFLVFADVELDGDPDLIVCGFQGVHVMRNTGAGDFNDRGDTEHYTTSGAIPSGVAPMDLNGDVYPDIALLDIATDSLSIRLNNGDGTFGAPATYPVGDLPRYVVGADIDGVNGPDLVVVNELSDNVHVVLNNGDGTMAAPVPYAVGDQPKSAALGDVNGDLAPDLVVSNYSGSVTVRFNAGSGTFGAAGTIPGVGSSPTLLVDLDNDADLDLLVGSNSGSMAFLNDGLGNFGAPRPSAIGSSFYAVADFDENGIPDVASIYSGSSAQSGTMVVTPGAGDGTFRSASRYPITAQGVDIGHGDLDGDDDLDLVVLTNTGAATLENLGNGTFASAVMYVSPSHSRGAMAVGDMDGDDDLDVVVTSYPANQFTILQNDGTGGLAAGAWVPVGASPEGVAVGDLNGDGDIDVVVSNKDWNNLIVYANNGDATFGVPVAYPTDDMPRQVAVADMDGDLDLDAVVVHEEDPHLTICLNDGTGVFTAYATPSMHPCMQFELGDLANDGDLDLVGWTEGSEYLFVLENYGGATFAPSRLRPTLESPLGVSFGDMNGDDYPDVLVNSSGIVAIAPSNTDGGFNAEWGIHLFTAGRNARASTLADFSGDGIPDLAFAGQVSVNVVLGEILVLPARCPADIDGDAYIDAGDFNILAAHFGTSVEPGASGDLNGDGVVNVADFAIFAANFGQNCP